MFDRQVVSSRGDPKSQITCCVIRVCKCEQKWVDTQGDKDGDTAAAATPGSTPLTLIWNL